jgi:hypothetical protein
VDHRAFEPLVAVLKAEIVSSSTRACSCKDESERRKMNAPQVVKDLVRRLVDEVINGAPWTP